jgi:hypothetical protein
MRFNEGSIPRRAIWTYGYALTPPVARDRMGPMRTLLDEGHEKARLASEVWEGRFVNGDGITHILVVSDRPDQDLEVNHLLEAELERLHAPFAMTRALAVGPAADPRT